MQFAGTNSCRISLKAMLTVMILKKGNESIFFQNNRFTACNVKDEKRCDKFFDGVQSTENFPFISM